MSGYGHSPEVMAIIDAWKASGEAWAEARADAEQVAA